MFNNQQYPNNFGNNSNNYGGPNSNNPFQTLNNAGAFSRGMQQPSQYGGMQQQPNQYGAIGADDVDGYNNYNQNYNNYNRQGSNSSSSRNNYRKNELYGGGEDDGLYANSRKGFIRKVYTILSIQLLITALVTVWAMNSQTFKNIFVNTPVMIIVSVLLMAVSIVVACCQEVMRKYGLPILIIFTLLFSILVGIICSMTKSYIVLTAFGITAFIVISLTIYACVTKTDLTGLGPYLFLFCMVLLVFGIVLIFWRNPIAHLVYSCLSCLLFCIYLIYDTQLVLGKFQNAYSLDDAYIAAIQLYIDIIQIFLQLIQILSFLDS